MKRLLLLAALVAAWAPAARAAHIWINEFHYDNLSTDAGEFVEVAVRSGVPFNAADFSVILYNGASTGTTAGKAYDTKALTAFTSSAPFPISGSSETVTFYSFAYPANGIQNGSPDGIALVNTVTPSVVEFLSYEGAFAAADGPAMGMMSTDIGVSENGAMTGTSIGYTGAGQAAEGFVFNLIQGATIGAPNNGQTLSATAPLPVRQTLDDTAGWRLLSAPVQDVTVGTLAGINLVQSVIGQYPDFPEDNLYLSYTGGGTAGLIAASDVAQPVVPGRGFFWYFFDQDITVNSSVFGGGTSQSYALPARQLAAAGPAVTADLSQTFSVNGDGSYMAGNPFDQALASTGVTQTAGGGTFQSTLQLYNPATGYIPVDRTTATNLATWQGFFAEVQGATAPVTFTYLAASRTAGTPELVGRPAARTQVALSLDGQVTVGDATAPVVDRAAIVRFSEAGRTGWDIDDASKLIPPGAVHALIAVVGELDGAERRQAVRSLPATQAEAAVDVQFTTTHAGRFELSAREVPAGWSVAVLDRATGATADLAAGPYAFTADAGEWTDRFAVTIAQGRTTAGAATPEAFELSAPSPNPSATEARLALRVDAAQRVTATVVDALGRTVATVFDGALAAGADQALVVSTARLAPGVYVVRVVGETFVQSRRLTVAR